MNLDRFSQSVDISQEIKIGAGLPVIFSGPCVIENEELCIDVAGKLKAICDKQGMHYVFKASLDKANRTSVGSFRSLGWEKGLEILSRVKNEIGVPIVTDVHETHQVEEASKVVDVIQIPAFLCRQTDLLLEAGKSGKAVKIKKGQFMAASDMKYAVDKVKSTGNEKVILTERGNSFGYHELVVDMRNLATMRDFCPVVFDVTHSVQRPGAQGGSSGGDRKMIPFLARAAAAAGVDGFFIETHPEPANALSDGPNMVPLHRMNDFLAMLMDFWTTNNNYRDFEI
ncbi:3-deoxy-8-phosphooctulonate synthase [Arthrospiribacter ruber]|uniref:2-dehydro-3-deoxyphosphooctonate aldolase n=1 Tax=Arthrospiribacter ruber TaxID=2487934 RepID=A0A951J1W2_9BACT|nr:3-deoxy-8-phosphooctulonate synthase [Arthrospiribacter ruber]MBW3469897.1 3-deoxy-8-phosphooctulonate synthase [Arthrospiribacter ruber]